MINVFNVTKSKSDSAWLNEWIKKLIEKTNNIDKNGQTTDYKHHTILKLITVCYYAGVFLKIVNKRKNSSSVYVDLFAGTGLVKIKDSKDDQIMPGSPLIAAQAESPFEYIICVEQNKEACAILKTRLKQTNHPNFKVIHGDCNKNISEVIDSIKANVCNPILLTFVDPEGLQIKFATLKKLNKAFPKCDFIVNVNSSAVVRVTGKIKKGIHNVSDNLKEYYDYDVQKILYDLQSGQGPQDIYKKLINEVLGKTIGDTIKIRGIGIKIAYYILGYSRETAAQAPYMDAFTALTKRFSKIDATMVRRELDKIYNRQASL